MEVERGDCVCYVGSLGSISVAELDWGNKTQIEAVGPPFDYVIGTDVVCILETTYFISFYFIISGVNSIKLLDCIVFKCGSIYVN